MTVAGVILAGGQGRRMGGMDKALVPLGGQPMVAHVIARLGPQVAALALNAGGDPGRFAGFGLPVLPDPVPDQPGPLAGVLAGMRWAAARGHSAVVSAAGDTPFFPADLVARLVAAAAEKGTPLACAATIDPVRGMNEHPTFGLWPVDLADDLETALVTGHLRKVILWTSRHGCARAVFAEGGHFPFFNVNTPQDLTEAARIHAETTGPDR